MTYLQLLDISENQFKGNISSLIAGLTSLKYIDLSYNIFEGILSFGSFANISKLEFLRFICDSKKADIETENSGWIPLFQLEFLEISNCNMNKLSNQISTFLFHQRSLRVLDLSYNNLKGAFPSWVLENNTRLEFVALNNNFFMGDFYLSVPLNKTNSMDVSDNQLSGQLQGNIGNILPKVRLLSLSKNAFEGYLPSSIGKMSLLVIFNVSFNKFSEEVPEELLTGCYQLEILDLSNNNFHGHFLSSNYNLTELEILKINDNQISGNLQNVLSKSFQLFVLDANNNNMSDKIPTWICNQTTLDTLLLRNNFFQGQIPCDTIQIRLLDLSQNSLSGSLPSWSSENLRHVHLGRNNFSGPIPKAFLNMSDLLTLDINDNRLSGRIPSAIGKFLSLKILLLRGNRLSGRIPTQLCQLININLMDLSSNFLSGTIPHCFHQISSDTITVSFSGSYIDFIQIVPFQYYTILQKSIKMPFKGLHYFHFGPQEGLYENGAQDEANFVTKNRISSYKGGILDYMSGLDFSCNNLTGGIPPELGQLSKLHALNLSHNQLTGSIPHTFSNLTELESMDLSNNNLNGQIPPQLIELHFLEVFSVAYNNLSGRTPETKAQFGTFSASSYEGNPFLCGLPLEKNCTSRQASPPTPTKSSNASDGKWYKVDQVVFFASFVVAYIMFFLGVVALLYINPYWRVRCFNLAEDCMYSYYYSVANTLRKLSARLYN